jgi:hypothetical protein
MKKITITALMLATLGTTSVFSNEAAISVVKDEAMSKVKSTAKETVVKTVAGDNPATKEIVKKVVDKVAPEANATEKVKSDVAKSLLGAS